MLKTLIRGYAERPSPPIRRLTGDIGPLSMWVGDEIDRLFIGCTYNTCLPSGVIPDPELPASPGFLSESEFDPKPYPAGTPYPTIEEVDRSISALQEL